MADHIEIEDLALRTFVGINPEEQAHKQDVIISLRLEVDLRAAGGSDDIEQTVNYRTLAKQVIAHVEEGRFLLVERMAEEIATLCLSGDERVLAVHVRVQKPGALRYARSVGVSIERTRG